MKTRGYLYVEIQINDSWSLAETLIRNPAFRHRKYHTDHEPEYIPQSRYLPGNTSIRESIIQVSGKRGLPADISPELLDYFNNRWKKENVFGKSWMTIEEIIECNDHDDDFYLNEEWFDKYSEPDKVRVVFWFVNLSEESK